MCVSDRDRERERVVEREKDMGRVTREFLFGSNYFCNLCAAVFSINLLLVLLPSVSSSQQDL